MRARPGAVLAAALGLCLLAYAGVHLAAPQSAPQSAELPPAPFVESLWQGGVPDVPAAPDYAPSASIAAAARLQETGLWPLSQSWYEYTPDGQPPKAAVVLLHGAGRDGLSMLEMWQATADRHGLLLIAPNAGPMRFGALGRRAVTATARGAAVAHGLPAEGLYLFGHSDGAVLAQDLVSSASPGQWRAAALHAGYRPEDGLGTAATDSPLRLYLGDADPIFPTAPARASLRAMAARGHPAELITIRGHGHWFYRIGPAIAEDSWRWFDSLQP